MSRMHLKLAYTCIRKLKIFAGLILRNFPIIKRRGRSRIIFGMIGKGREDEGGKGKEGEEMKASEPTANPVLEPPKKGNILF
jgi:hypothetical protein